jgi:hypothetical protein
MKTSVWSSGLLICLFTQGLIAQNYPKTDISNKLIRAVIMLPNAQHGSYQGTRFDWSGVISTLQSAGHNYIAHWHKQDDPKINDAITGPAEEFLTSLGYDQAKPGGTFVRIGVGILRKPDEKAFQRFKTYDIVEPGQWNIRKGKNWIEFNQKLASDDGYAYVYEKTLRLMKGKPELVIEHSLKNVGEKTIETDEYSHNFFVIDHEVVGPDIAIRFSFAPKPTSKLQNGAEIHGQTITFLRDLQKDESVFTELDGFGQGLREFNIRIENLKSGAGVEISGNRPLTKVVFWSIHTVACPETYIHLHLQPGEEARWETMFNFYTMTPPHKN